MVSFKSLLVAATGALAVPFTESHARDGIVTDALSPRAGTPPSQGEHDGFFYYFWTDGGGTVNYENKDDGSYAVNWQECSNFIGGKGWSPGTPRTITFDANFNTTGNGYLSIYGWMTNPRVEYNIIETFGTFDPSVSGTSYGAYDADGSEYKLARTVQYSHIGIPGSQTLDRIWAVRQNERTSGSVDVGVHLEAWKAKGLRLGAKHEYQIVGTEGYQSSGESSVTVS